MPGSGSPPPDLATIIVTQSGNPITSWDFGNGAVHQPGTPVSFTILNSGSNTVSLGGSGTVQVTGDISDFTVTAPAASTLAAGASTTFTIAFSPSALGPRTATAKIIPASGGKEASFTVTGTGESYLIAVSAVTSSDFGVVTTGSPSSADFRIVNQGTASITIDHIGVGGTNASEFVPSAPHDSTLAADAATTFKVTFTPASYGTRTAQVTVYVTTPTVTQCTINVSGTGTSGAFRLADASDPTTPIQNNATSSNTVWTTQGIIKHYIITNAGSSPLYLLPAGASMVITGDTGAISLSSPQPGAAAIAASGTQDFSILAGHEGLANGTYSVTVTIQTSDASNPTFTFHIDMDYRGQI